MQPDNDFYRNLLDNLYDGVYFVDRERRITYWNKGAERLSGFTSTEVIGLCCHDNVLEHVNDGGCNLCKGECPVSATLLDGTMREAEVFLHHRAGHRVPVLARVSPIRNVSGEIIGAIEIFSDNSSRIADLQRIEELQQLVFLDPLTGLANRRYIQKNLQSRFDEMYRYGWAFGLMLLDLDLFKMINDRYGHDVGDDLLKMIAKTLHHAARSYDLVGRWGGEEFLVVLANVSQSKLAYTAERFRRLVEESSLPVLGDTVRVTISIGATLATPQDSVGSLIKRTDELMYRSKAAGRNCATCG